MNLQEFVKSTLEQVVQGVDDARKQHPGIAPELEHDPKLGRHTINMAPVFLIEFDVAVTVVEASTTGGGGGISVLSVASIKGGTEKHVENASVSRVKFGVPVNYEAAKVGGA